MAAQLRDWPWNELAIALQLGYALVLSALIGWERERHRRPAGLRTHILVAVSATMVTAIGEQLVARYAHLDDGVTTDPSRVVHGLLTGIGFIGAGTIFQTRRGDTVLGVTTAASLFAVTVLGIAIGLGFYVLAAVAALIIFGVLRILGPLEHSLAKASHTADQTADQTADPGGGEQPRA
ncbi:MAG TPA: MgtC/SapB family protein [Haliangium sp.]|nr:MgtC/SapB family protein [Haliangium sp.]